MNSKDLGLLFKLRKPTEQFCEDILPANRKKNEGPTLKKHEDGGGDAEDTDWGSGCDTSSDEGGDLSEDKDQEGHTPPAHGGGARGNGQGLRPTLEDTDTQKRPVPSARQA